MVKVVGYKSLSTKRVVVESLSDIETSILIKLQSIANILFLMYLKNCGNV